MSKGFDAREHAETLNALEPFEYTHTDDTVYELPNAAVLSIAQVTAIESGGDALVDTLAEVWGDDAYEAISSLPIQIGEQLITAWMKAGGRLGKSVPLSRSTRPGGGHSNSTRRSGGSRSRKR